MAGRSQRHATFRADTLVRIIDGRTPSSPPASTGLAASCRRRALHGLRLVRRRVRPPPSQPRSQAMEEVVDPPRRESVHRVQRLRSDLPFSRDHHAKRLNALGVGLAAQAILRPGHVSRTVVSVRSGSVEPSTSPQPSPASLQSGGAHCQPVVNLEHIVAMEPCVANLNRTEFPSPPGHQAGRETRGPQTDN